MVDTTASAIAINKRSVIAGVIGNIFDWYDFAVFGFFAAAISAHT